MAAERKCAQHVGMTEIRIEPTFSASAPITPQEPARHRPRSVAPIVVPLLIAGLAAAGWFWFSQAGGPRVAAPAPAASVAQPAAEPAPAAQYPALQPPDKEDVVAAGDVTAALERLLGRESVLKFLQATDFPRRLVATVDNLGREHAPPAVWPVQPAPGRFLVEGDRDSHVIGAENALRYAPFVAFAGSVDAAQAVKLYRRMYPTLEQAYRDLGFTDRSLNARVFEVIDLLLATPEPAQPPRMTLTEVKGPVASVRPWTRYEYAEAKLERLAAGQKILLRIGTDNRRVLKAKLRELRQELLKVSSEQARP
jgi:hypothetical protein